jgi:radical SAM protein (TIGR01212 family)
LLPYKSKGAKALSEKKMWGDKPYYSLDYYLKETFGRKIYKISLNAGLTCPNRDGTLGRNGCIFCSEGGSGDFSASPFLSITSQIEEAKKRVSAKLPAGQKSTSQAGQASFIAYFQAYTNTYGEISYLRKIFYEALCNEDVALLSIATRPDCLGKEVLALLSECTRIKPLWVELGLQTIHEDTARLIRRGYPLSVFEKAVKDLNSIGAKVIVHMILGLPGESSSMVLSSMDYLGRQQVHGIKLQLLHVLKNTELAALPYKALTLEEYTDLLLACLERLPQNMAIHRLTGDGPKKLLLAPLWSRNKKLVLNFIRKEMKARDSWQGKML